MIKKILTVDISTAFSLKLIALMFMILDHVHTYLHVGPSWISLLTRFVSALFVFFLVEGFNYSKNRKRYLGRLFSFSIIMLGGNITINSIFHRTNILTNEMDFYSLIQGNNIFMTLTAFFCVLLLLEKIKNSSIIKKLLYLLGATSLSLFQTLCFNSKWAMAFVLIPIYLYSGKRGRNDIFAKWLFYVIYPLHIWILVILNLLFIK